MKTIDVCWPHTQLQLKWQFTLPPTLLMAHILIKMEYVKWMHFWKRCNRNQGANWCLWNNETMKWMADQWMRTRNGSPLTSSPPNSNSNHLNFSKAQETSSLLYWVFQKCFFFQNFLPPLFRQMNEFSFYPDLHCKQIDESTDAVKWILQSVYIPLNSSI